MNHSARRGAGNLVDAHDGYAVAFPRIDCNAARMAVMRRWVLMLLLCVLPVQLVWAAAAPYCAHEANSTVKQHFGHHEHQHKAGSGGALSEDEPSPTGVQHLDCEACHFGCSVTMPNAGIVIGFLPETPANALADPPDTSYIPSGPERPDRAKRSAAARFGRGVANVRSTA
jgi:hypothetical protein